MLHIDHDAVEEKNPQHGISLFILSMIKMNGDRYEVLRGHVPRHGASVTLT